MIDTPILDFAEKKAEETLKLLRASYDDLHERIHKVVTGLIGGAGAVGAFALGSLAKDNRMQGLTLGLLAGAWFAIALYLTVRGARSRELSPGNGPKNILKYFSARLAEQQGASDPAAVALRLTREAELELQQKRIRTYGDACISRAIVLDQAYICVALSPLAPIAALGVAWFR